MEGDWGSETENILGEELNTKKSQRTRNLNAKWQLSQWLGTWQLGSASHSARCSLVFMTLQGPACSCLSCQSFLFLMSGNHVLCYHLLLGESQTLPNLKSMGRSMQSSEEVNMLCALVLSLFFLPSCRLAGMVNFSSQKLLPVFIDMRTSIEDTTNRWQIQDMFNSLSEVWPATTW